MSPDLVSELLRQLMKEAMILTAPVLVATVLLGFVLTLFQTLTNVQDQSLTSVPRLLAVAAILLGGMPWFLGRITAYAMHLMGDLHRYLG
ncbi:flagellar biosynthetic protein FliQ [Occallatibacter savannae]|uniref:flagellar biosynthetic protein FliQ n=1 Tax=Occallatibacter savannae TaxID=1002691 RepID=UPI000D68C203|nr:flagellar biosynthetic protein FliQ [Occallatibacter savannae]